MSHNNVTEFGRGTAAIIEDVTLDKLVLAMTNWRANKKNPQEAIPEEIWQQITLLLNKFPEATLRAATGITGGQMAARKLKESKDAKSVLKISAAPTPIQFCEVKEEKSMPLYKPEKIPATNTLIVEFCRADGQIMKIHTTTDSFADLMKAFFEGK